MYEWLNAWRITTALEQLDDPEVVEQILDALERIATQPTAPEGVEVLELRVPPGEMNRWVAWLPGGLHLTYRIHENGPPPRTGPHLTVLAFGSHLHGIAE